MLISYAIERERDRFGHHTRSGTSSRNTAQRATRTSPSCAARSTTAAKGSGSPRALARGRIAHLAVALLGEPHGEPVAAAIDVTCTPQEFRFSLVEWKASPWRTETYLGTVLEPDQVSAGPERSMFFHVAKHVTDDLSDVRAYFA